MNKCLTKSRSFKQLKSHQKVFVKVDQAVAMHGSGLIFPNEFATKRKLQLFPDKQVEACRPVVAAGIFETATRRVFQVAQLFALLPVSGLRHCRTNALKFNVFSIHTLYSAVISIGILIIEVLNFYKSLRVKITFNDMVSIFFFGSSLVFSLICITIARKWPSLMKKWKIVENFIIGDKQHRDQLQRELSTRILTISTVVLLLSLIEHILAIISGFYQTVHCENKIVSYFLRSFPQIFAHVDYNIGYGIFGQLLVTICTFYWNFMDLLIICVSIGLTHLFQQINTDLSNAKEFEMPELFWIMQKQKYNKVRELLHKVDDTLAFVILLSFSNNLYFICVQLLNSFNKMENLVHGFYFWYSLVFLICRTLAVSLYSSNIHEESMRPRAMIRLIPSELYNIEIQRFLEEVTNDVIALSGMRFFYLTRTLILKVAGTIVTYELVLVQFNESAQKDGNPCF